MGETMSWGPVLGLLWALLYGGHGRPWCVGVPAPPGLFTHREDRIRLGQAEAAAAQASTSERRCEREGA